VFGRAIAQAVGRRPVTVEASIPGQSAWDLWWT